MRKMYVTSAALLMALAANAQYGEIQNGGFEDWTTNTLFNYPDQWANSNRQEPLVQPAVVRSTDAQEGIYSTELRVNDDVGAYIYHGQVNMGITGGIPYTDTFDNVRFQYKCDFPVGDSLYLLMIRFTSGVQTDTVIVPVIHGTQMTWMQAAVPIPAGTQDELFFALSMGDPINEISISPGSWARIDKVELYNGAVLQTNLPNHNFEIWTTQTLESADGWYSYNEGLVGLDLNNANKTTDAHSGNFAMEMKVVEDAVTHYVYPSAISMGPIWGGLTPVPYVASPTTFSGWYKLSSPYPNDNALTVVEFFENGNLVGASIQTLDISSNYAYFSYPLTITGTPDSVEFSIYSGMEVGSVLVLDDLEFSGGNVGLSEFAQMNVSVYPNPASTEVMIKAEGEYAADLIDLTGKVIMSMEQAAGIQVMNVENVIPGTYLLRLKSGNTTSTHKLVVE